MPQHTKNWPGVIWTYEVSGITSFWQWFKMVPTFFPFCKNFDFKNETWKGTDTISAWHNHYSHHTIHSVIQVRGHLPQLTTVLLLPRSNLLPDAIHWNASSRLNKVSHRCSYKDGQNINVWKDCRWYGCPSVLRHNFLLPKDILQHFHNVYHRVLGTHNFQIICAHLCVWRWRKC